MPFEDAIVDALIVSPVVGTPCGRRPGDVHQGPKQEAHLHDVLAESGKMFITGAHRELGE